MEKYRDHSNRRKDAAPLEQAFDELLRAYRLKDKFDQKVLMQAWPELMGNTVAKRTTSLFIKDKKLFVKISSGAVKQELSMNRSKVMGLIETRFGKGVIDELIFL